MVKVEHMSVIAIGHVDCGKTTIVAALRSHLDARYIANNIRQQQQLTMPFGYAYRLDKLRCSRELGISVDLEVENIETEKYNWTLIDPPGHRDFIKNFIVGLTQADVALLLVAAPTGEFEAGIHKTGQTREHCLLAYTMGVKQIIVVVNKMDDKTVNYSEARYKEIKTEVSQYLKKVGYNPDKVHFVPVSSWMKQNLVNREDRLHWYKGPTLVEALDSMVVPKRPEAKPLRIPVRIVHKIGGIGTVAQGRVASGSLKPGDLVTCAPMVGTAPITVTSIERHHVALTEAKPGDQIGFVLKGVSCKEVKRGFVFGNAKQDPPALVEAFTAQIIMLALPGSKPLSMGWTPMFHFHTISVTCKVQEFLSRVDKASGPNVNTTQLLKSGDAGMVRIVPSKPICIETFAEYPALGRFCIRDGKMTVAVGIVKEVERQMVLPTVLPTKKKAHKR